MTPLIVVMFVGPSACLLFFGALAVFGAYQDGFMDGCRYMKEGDGYPDKPHRSWEGWAEIQRLRDGE